jgi:methylated-DNA-[protein]-cysteine S-methyltransferase
MTRNYSCFQTEQGWGGVVASERGLVEVLLPFGCPSRDEREFGMRERFAGSSGECILSSRAADLLVQYFRGDPVSFDLPLDLPHGSAFRENVYRFVAAIPWGMVKTYAEVAAATGRPRAFRAVGGAMARNPVPVIIPCHRVVGSSGAMTGYSAPGGIGSKEWLLTLEGVFCRKNAV